MEGQAGPSQFTLVRNSGQGHCLYLTLEFDFSPRDLMSHRSWASPHFQTHSAEPQVGASDSCGQILTGWGLSLQPAVKIHSSTDL